MFIDRFICLVDSCILHKLQEIKNQRKRQKEFKVKRAFENYQNINFLF